MQMIPLFRVSNMSRSLDFYTKILDFVLAEEGDGPGETVMVLRKEQAYLMLTSLEGDQRSAINALLWMMWGIDELFALYISRGLDTSAKKDSPVHQGPLDQSWGTREFYVTDPDGNTLRFVQSPS